MLIPIILAGGAGTRLWPLSQPDRPKQFLALTSSKTMLQLTAERLQKITAELPLTVCNEQHRFLVAEQLRASQRLGSVIVEPCGRNTAPAIALAAQVAMQRDKEALILILPADHHIEDAGGFAMLVNQARSLAEQGEIVTFGLHADHPNTQYGYIKGGQPKGAGFQVVHFTEKPNAALAADYIAAGDYYWNSGIFLCKARVYLEELAKFRPEIVKHCKRALDGLLLTEEFIKPRSEYFVNCISESIDYAVMEHTQRAVVIPANIGWSDIGSWPQLWDCLAKDKDSNVSKGSVEQSNNQGCLIISEGVKLFATGLTDLVVVATNAGVIVSHKAQHDDLQRFIEEKL